MGDPLRGESTTVRAHTSPRPRRKRGHQNQALGTRAGAAFLPRCTHHQGDQAWGQAFSILLLTEGERHESPPVFEELMKLGGVKRKARAGHALGRGP